MIFHGQACLYLQLSRLKMTDGGRFFTLVRMSVPHGLDHSLHVSLHSGTFVDDRPFTHHDDAVAVIHDLRHLVRNQNANTTAADELTQVLEQLLRRLFVQRRSRLIENDQFQGLIARREGHRNLHHLTFGNRDVFDDLAGGEAMAREYPVQGLHQLLACLFAPPKTIAVRCPQTHVFGEAEIGAQRQLLEDAADAMPDRFVGVPVMLHLLAVHE
jgi:hypothetical protein